ncbi:hypothetical protein AAFF_G00050100 [Aldrovandia affinis]|uniref:Protein FAM161A n=1 Tax=Aldrovandia affinis TaxID=143900 RepID=A0AAD7S1K4_9TELE|nr:hypothetical protein AAFF_G00050100 [Aldrovandia affinis]
MTVREAERKRRKVKSRSEVELENALLRKQLEEATECQKKFRASPVPAHVYLPLYEELAARGDQRRQLYRHREQHNLQASQKPFSFLERERLKREQRDAQPPRDAAPEGERRAFRAKPVPRSVYDSTVGEQLKEEQLYRAIKMQMRARELLHSASVPRSMLAERLAERRRDAGDRAAETEADFRPRINGEVPDFDASYRKFRKQLESRRDVRPMTVCEPFRLRTARISSHRHRDIEAERTSPKATRWPYVAPAARTASSSLSSSLSGSQELLPAKITDAAKMRQEAVRKVLEQRRQAEEEEERWRVRQRQRERRLQKVITKRAQANDPHVALSQTCKSKLKQFRKQDLQRRKEYREEMREIQERVKGRPLLLEQVTQRNAKRAAEKRYADTLRGCGLSEDFVSSMAPKQQQQQQQRGLPVDQSSVSSEGTQSGKEEPTARPSAEDYLDDYEEFDEREAYGEEKEPDDGDPEHKEDTGAEEEDDDKADQSDQEVDENDQRGDKEDHPLDTECDGSKGEDVESGKERGSTD